MSVADRLNKLSTDITSAYTSIENKGGTTPANKNTNNLSTAINSIEVIEQATAEGESLSLANTKAMPYSDYIVEGKSEQEGEPSPSNPSEIYSVADDVNLFTTTNNFVQIVGYANYEILGTNSLSVSATGTTYSYRYVKFKLENLIVGKTYYLKAKATNTNSEASKCLYVRNSADDTTLNSSENWQDNSILSFVPTETTVIIRFYANGNTAVINTCVWSDIKISTFNNTPYSPYNQGTVTIKQRGTTESNDYIIQTEPLRSLPNGVKDTIEADGIHRRVGRVVLDGSEISWNYYTETNKPVFYLMTEEENIFYKQQSGLLCLSNYYQGKGQATSFDNIYDMGNNTISFRTTFTRLVIRNDNITNVNDFKTWLATHNTEVLYPLAEEVIEPLTQNQANTLLDITHTGSYENTTNIYTDEDVKPTIGVGYYKKS